MINYKKSILCISSISAALLFAGCASSNGPTMVSKGKGGVTVSEKDGIKNIEYITCSQPTGKKIVVSNIKCKASGCQKNAKMSGSVAALLQLAGKSIPDFSTIGTGLGNMLQTSLDRTKCFDVLDRETMKELKEEMALAGKSIKMDSADILVTGAITSITYKKERSAVGGGFIPFLGAIKKDTNSADLGMDMKVVDVNSAKIVLSQDYYAKSGMTKYGFMGGTWGSGGAFGGAFSSMNGTSMEEVSRDVINRLTYDIVKQFAPNSYKIVTEQIK